ncbi:2-hydroxyacid dehydrogenase [Chitinophaga tropicalis]|uniref:Glyoxylate/hydroxypyruvate reductase B n=1 Tax=Chitinophaga tropicalis TaxID=2683588 RepID=A0A7K1U8J7_9BACT|nr:D-glycerate dehydrogenase [Chitinophaga tropicalis]MVT10692.1 D-glycerate dehydrogenase [Chitinophaga tropicalis]
MKVFITRNIPATGLQLLREAGIETTIWTDRRDLTPDELISRCKEHDALLSSGPNKIDRSFLEACKHLKVVSLLSVGYDNVDVEAAKTLGIPVGNTPGVLSGATADTAFLLMLSVSRKAFFMHKEILKGNWNFWDPTANLGIELNGKTLGILGLGKIGFELAKKCIGAYDMKVIYHNRGRNEEAEKKLGAVRVSFDELLQQSDVVSVHTALTPETTGIFDKAAFSKMKPSSIFINTARGGVHNEPDLVAALQNGMIWGAGLDVTNPEPMEPGNPLLEMPNVAILPHIGSATEETRAAMSVIAARNVIAGLKGDKLPHSVV